MKIRSGFVSNSSSSSFICENRSNISLNDVEEILYRLYELYVFTQSKLNDDNKSYRLKTFDDMFQKPFIVKSLDEEYVKMMSGWIPSVKHLVGKLIINSTDDNSIPYEFFGIIEDTFNGERIHLG